MDAPTKREADLNLAIAAAYAEFHEKGALAPFAEVLRLVRIHVADEVADQAAGLHRENARLRETLTKLPVDAVTRAAINPGPTFFRQAAIHAALARQAGQSVPAGARYWSAQATGAPHGLFGFGPYTRPNHHRVIAFLLLEIIAREGL